MTVGSRIKARRNELGLSQREMAARLGYTDHTTLARIEADKVDLPQSRIVKIAEVLGTTPADLMGWSPEDQGAMAAEVLRDPALLQLVEKYLAMDAADRQTLCTLADRLTTTKKG